LISVDLPAPFSPMSEWTSPGRRVKSTPSRARTPGKRIVMPVISTTGGSVLSADIGGILRFSCVGTPAGGVIPRRGARRIGVRSGSVQPLVDDLGGLLGREGLVGHVVGLLDLLAGKDVLDDPGGQVSQQRVALDDEVDL